MILRPFFFFLSKIRFVHGRCVARENEIPVSINYREDWKEKKKKKKEPYATDVSALDRKEGNISATMVQKWQEGDRKGKTEYEEINGCQNFILWHAGKCA